VKPSPLKLLRFVILLSVVTVAVAFVIQNSSRSVLLTLDLGFWGVQTKDPVTVPALMGASLLTGLFLAGSWGVRVKMKTKNTIRDLKKELWKQSLEESGEL